MISDREKLLQEQLDELVPLARGLYGLVWAITNNPLIAHAAVWRNLAEGRMDEIRAAGWDSITDWFDRRE